MIAALNHLIDKLIGTLFPPLPEGAEYCQECGGAGQSKYWGTCSHCHGIGIVVKEGRREP
jgi:mono/diheme cytochrome c family protein